MTTEYRVPSTTKVTGMIQAHADLLAQHGISAGVEASRPAAGTADRYYFCTDTNKWCRDNGSSWDEVSGLSEAYIQGLIDTSVATLKDYVDSLVQGLDWQNSVLGELADPPGSPSGGDRYLIIATATGAWAGHENDVTEYIDSAWVFFTPNEGFACRVEDVDLQKVYNGTAWVTFGSTVNHANLTNVLPSQHHAAPAYDGGSDEVVFQI